MQPHRRATGVSAERSTTMSTVLSFDLQDEFTSPELEARLLVTILKNPTIYYEIMDWVPPIVWTYYRKDFEQLAQAIQKDTELPTLSIQADPVENPEEAAKHLVDLYQRRESARLHQLQLQKLYQQDIPAKQLLLDTEKQLTNIQSHIRELQLGQMVSVPDLFDDLLDQLQERYQLRQEQKTNVVGLPTGFSLLDKHLGGLQEGIHLLAGEPGMGKSTFALQIARTVAKKTPVIFVSFEEPLDRLTLKCICAIGNHDIKQFNEGWSSPEALIPTMSKYRATLSHLHLIQGKKDLTVNEVMARARQLIQKHSTNQCLIIIDYLQRWAAHLRNNTNDFRHTVRELASDIRESLALKLKSPVLVISSQNRERQGEAKLSSLKESGDLEYDADSALFLTKDDETPNEVILSIKKNRFGENDQKFKLYFKANLGSFEEVGYA